MNTLMVKHNMEVAHRLSLLPGKCQNIHGHSMQVQLTIAGLEINENGIAGGIDFGALKKMFRTHIDTVYDHHLHLNKDDGWAQPLHDEDNKFEEHLPGLITHPGDPTVENLAKWLCEDMKQQLQEAWPDIKDCSLHIDIKETGTNGAGWTEEL